MKILIDLTSLADNFSGIERFALNISRELVRKKEHTFILLFKGKPAKEFDIEAENITAISMKPCGKLWFNQIRLMRTLYGYKADAYLFPAFPEPVLFFSEKVFPFIFDMGCRDCPETMRLLNCIYFRFSYWKSARMARRILTVSGFSRGRISELERIGPERIDVIYSGVDARFTKKDSNEVREKYRLPGKYILSLSTLEPRKNLALLIEAYSRLSEVEELPELVLAGRKGWKVDDLLSGVPESVVSRIHFTGFISDEDLPALYSGASLFVFPSKYEGFGIPPLEAMACEIPVVSSNAASLPEVLGSAAVYFESGDAKDLAQKITQCLNEGTTDAQIKKGKEQAAGFQWEQQAMRLLHILQNA